MSVEMTKWEGPKEVFDDLITARALLADLLREQHILYIPVIGSWPAQLTGDRPLSGNHEFRTDAEHALVRHLLGLEGGDTDSSTRTETPGRTRT